MLNILPIISCLLSTSYYTVSQTKYVQQFLLYVLVSMNTTYVISIYQLAIFYVSWRQLHAACGQLCVSQQSAVIWLGLPGQLMEKNGHFPQLPVFHVIQKWKSQQKTGAVHHYVA